MSTKKTMMPAGAPAGKYVAFAPLGLSSRNWPEAVIERAPLWCSVDLRDGNQALVEPMGSERKLRMFKALVDLGFAEIEIGFPSASETDFAFTRRLIEEGHIPDHVVVQVLTQAREDLIDTTIESLRGVRRAIVHLYNSTSALQRRVVFRTDVAGVTDIAVRGARAVLAAIARKGDADTEWWLQYSPESYTGTEPEVALAVCEAVDEVWRPSRAKRICYNLPSTVEMSTPNIFADMIEHFCAHFSARSGSVISVHPHNDRGTAVAAAELALMAGADRVEGTLFGNGERTGNVDVVTLALNMFTQGVDPGLDFSDIDAVRELVEYCNRLPVHARHPYVGELVYTAFSGSHQDAIKKGFAAQRASNSPLWSVPYLPIDPRDVGRSYEAVVRINSQSGKGGVAYVLEADYGLRLPRRLQIELSRIVQREADDSGAEIEGAQIYQIFCDTYMRNERGVFNFVGHSTTQKHDDGGESSALTRALSAQIRYRGELRTIEGVGNGPISAYLDALSPLLPFSVEVADYEQHTLSFGKDATSVTYIELKGEHGRVAFGVGRDPNIVTASLQAVTSALNKALEESDEL